MSAIPIHPALVPLQFVLGTWKGEGEGGFPTITGFRYGEELKFWHVGKPVIAYAQKTWKLGNGVPMHSEFGFIRPQPDGSIDFLLTESTGIVEVQKGTLTDPQTLRFRSSLIGNATKVKSVTRELIFKDNELIYTLQMETNSQELQNHLKATLFKQDA